MGSIDDVTTAEQIAKAARSGRDLEVLNAENIMRNIALACEAVDRREEALLSAAGSCAAPPEDRSPCRPPPASP